jgi:hypothetical protein
MLRTGVSVPKEEKHLAKGDGTIEGNESATEGERKRGVRGSECRVGGLKGRRQTKSVKDHGRGQPHPRLPSEPSSDAGGRRY